MAKVYAVKKGYKTGVFFTWDECQKQTKGYKGAEFKSFNSEPEANDYLNGNDANNTGMKNNNDIIIMDSISVDGACAGNPGKGEFKVVFTNTKKEIFSSKVYSNTTNNIMEFLALVYAIKYVINNNLNIPIYADSVTSMAWVRDRKINSTFTNIETDEALEWLNDNQTNIKNIKILKWHTSQWGEIPADFGRK